MENNAWVFDSLVGFLHGPVWNIPLQTFIEEKSLPFEPTENGEVLDRPEYKAVHDEYKNLVDVMLGSFMDDIGITTEQFEAACRLSARDLAGLPAHFHRRLFEQIWAANDYDIFVKMMTHKNVELQLQALELIERRFGALPNIFVKDTEEQETQKHEDTEDWSDRDDVMTEVKKLQLEDSPVKEVDVPPEDVVEEKKRVITKLQKFGKAPAPKLPDEETEGTSASALHELSSVSKHKKQEVSEAEVRARQEYLKQQRDKLLALKKQVREKKLDDNIESGDGDGTRVPALRPKSAKVAQAAMAGAAPLPSPDAMQLRRALASRLKTEVVDNSI